MDAKRVCKCLSFHRLDVVSIATGIEAPSFGDIMAVLTPFERMELACRRLGLSHGELAARLAVSTETVRQWGMNDIPTAQFERLAPNDSSTDAAVPPLIWEQALQAPIAWIEHGADPPVWWITELVSSRRWSEVEDVRRQHAREAAKRSASQDVRRDDACEEKKQLAKQAADAPVSAAGSEQPQAGRSAWPQLEGAQLECLIFSAWKELVDGCLAAHLLSVKKLYLLPGPPVPRWKFLLSPYRWYWGNQEPAKVQELAQSLGCWPPSATMSATPQWESLPTLLRRRLASDKKRPPTTPEVDSLPSSGDPAHWTVWKRAIEKEVDRFRKAKSDPARRLEVQERVRLLLMERRPDELLVAGVARAAVLSTSLRAAWGADIPGPSSDRIRSALEAALWCELANRRFTMTEVSRSLELRTGIAVKRSDKKRMKRVTGRLASSLERSGVVSDRTVCALLRAIEETGREPHRGDHYRPRVRCIEKTWSTLPEDLDT